jgi:hypothetical protein
VTEVGEQAVRDVDARARPPEPGQRAARRDARLGSVSQAPAGALGARAVERGSAEEARHEQAVAGARSAPAESATCAHRTDGGDGERRLGRARHVAPDERAAVRRALGERAPHEAERERGVELRRRGEGEREAARRGPHRRQVREVCDERAPADPRRRLPSEAEVHSLDEGVCRQRHVLAARRAEQRRVVADPERHARALDAPREALDARDQAELAELAEVHARSVAPLWARRVQGRERVCAARELRSPAARCARA